MTAAQHTSPSENGARATNLFAEADPEQHDHAAPARNGTLQRPRRGRGLVVPLDPSPGRAIPGSDAARFARPDRGIGRLSARARAELRAADVRAAAMLRLLAARRHGAVATATALAALLIALSWLGLALRDASAARRSAERARSTEATALGRDQARIADLNAQLTRTQANARRDEQAIANWRARAMTAGLRLTQNPHPRPH